jgi:hypothetical protein
LNRNTAGRLRAGDAGNEWRAARTHDAARDDRRRNDRETGDGEHEYAAHLQRLIDMHMTDPLYPLESAVTGTAETRGIPLAAASCFVTDMCAIRKCLWAADARDWAA